MSQSIVQQSSPVNFGGTNATAQATLTGVTAGNRLMVFAFGWGGNTYPAFTASDGTNSYTQQNANSGDPTGARISATVLYRENVESGSHTVTVTHASTSGNRYGWFVLAEVSGGKTTAGLISACTAKIETGTTTYTNPSITAAATPGVNATAFSVFHCNVSGTNAGIDSTTGTPASWTRIFVEQDNNAEAAGVADLGAITSAQTANAACGTLAAAATVAAIIVVFEDASSDVSLTVADAAHSHAVDNVTLSLGLTLAVADALHSHSVDNLTLGGTRQFSFTLYGTDGVTPVASRTGLWWAWWDTIAHVRTAAANAEGTGAATDASGVFTVTAPSGLSPGNNQGFGIVSDQDSTPDATEAAYVGSFDVI